MDTPFNGARQWDFLPAERDGQFNLGGRCSGVSAGGDDSDQAQRVWTDSASAAQIAPCLDGSEADASAIDASRQPGVGKPRYLIDVADIAVFEQRRAAGPQPKPVRRRRDPNVIEFV